MISLWLIQAAVIRTCVKAARLSRRAAALFVMIAIAITPVPAAARGMSAGHSVGGSAGFSRSAHSHGFHRGRFFSHRGEFGRSHRRERREFADWYYPYGFSDWYYPDDWYYRYGNYDAPSYADPDGDDRLPRFYRYERPTMETTPSGVVIMRGPGSRHF